MIEATPGQSGCGFGGRAEMVYGCGHKTSVRFFEYPIQMSCPGLYDK